MQQQMQSPIRTTTAQGTLTVDVHSLREDQRQFAALDHRQRQHVLQVPEYGVASYEASKLLNVVSVGHRVQSAVAEAEAEVLRRRAADADGPGASSSGISSAVPPPPPSLLGGGRRGNATSTAEAIAAKQVRYVANLMCTGGSRFEGSRFAIRAHGEACVRIESGCTFDRCGIALDVSGVGAECHVDGRSATCAFRLCQIGISIEAPSLPARPPTVCHADFITCRRGIVHVGNGSLELEEATFRGSRAAGVCIDGSHHAMVRTCLFEAAAGAGAEIIGGKPTFIGNTFRYNVGPGVVVAGAASIPVLQENLFLHNGLEGAAAYDAALFLAPKEKSTAGAAGSGAAAGARLRAITGAMASSIPTTSSGTRPVSTAGAGALQQPDLPGPALVVEDRAAPLVQANRFECNGTHVVVDGAFGLFTENIFEEANGAPAAVLVTGPGARPVFRANEFDGMLPIEQQRQQRERIGALAEDGPAMTRFPLLRVEDEASVEATKNIFVHSATTAVVLRDAGTSAAPVHLRFNDVSTCLDAILVTGTCVGVAAHNDLHGLKVDIFQSSAATFSV
jgi:hypothetical protein